MISVLMHTRKVGNEDHFSNGMTSYKAYRFRMFFDAISAAYPNLTILSSTIELDSLPAGAAIDYHDYGVSASRISRPR